MVFINLLLISTSFAQEEFIEPPAKLITEFRFKILSGGVVLLNGTVGDVKDTLNFILDTGSGGISLDSTAVEYFGLKKEPSNKFIRGIGGVKKVSFVNNQKLSLPGLTVENLNFHIVDYSVLSSVYGLPIDGIIGYSVLSRYVVSINYDNLLISFFTQGEVQYPKGGWSFKPSIAYLPIQSLTVKDAAKYNSRFLYDIGAGLCILFSKDFIRDSSFLMKRGKLYNKQAEGVGGKIDMELTVIKEVRLGPYKFRKVPVLIFDDVYNVLSYPYLSGLIGNDLLRRFNVIMDYSKQIFYLKPNSHFYDPFDYSYAGLELYLIDGVITIGDVAVGSPAEKAGLKEGDIVIGINNDLSQILYKYKNFLQEPGTKVKIMVQRNKELLEYEFRILNIGR